MPKIIICENMEDIGKLSSDSIAIISGSRLPALSNPEKGKRLKDILDTAFNQQDFIPTGDIETYEISKSLRAVNKKVKVFNDKIIDVDLLQILLKEDIIPVLIV